MTTITSPATDHPDALRAALPVLVSVAVLCAVVLVGALLARNLVEFGLMFLTES
jgi:hypothetical protein